MPSYLHSQTFGAALAIALVLAAAHAQAAEPQGCDGFRWSLDAERQAMVTAASTVESGATIPVPNGTPLELETRPISEAGLLRPPERASRRPEARATFLRIAEAVPPGRYQIAISEPAWLDVTQDDRFLKPAAFTGAEGCPGIRKAIRVDLEAKPTTLTLSDVAVPRITVLITRVSQ